jgi:AcrR family transcriptional regulator
MEAILTAAEQEFALHGYNGTAVREVAARAGVTHALVHRYFGTKTDLFRAVLARNEDVILDAASGEDDLSRSATLMIDEGLARHREYLRLIVFSCLRGTPYDRSIVKFSATERLIELARLAASERSHQAEGGDATAAETDRRLAVATVVALLLGWASMEPWLVKAAGIEGLDDETAAAGVERAARILLEGWLLV